MATVLDWELGDWVLLLALSLVLVLGKPLSGPQFLIIKNGRTGEDLIQIKKHYIQALVSAFYMC